MFRPYQEMTHDVIFTAGPKRTRLFAASDSGFLQGPFTSNSVRLFFSLFLLLFEKRTQGYGCILKASVHTNTQKYTKVAVFVPRTHTHTHTG